jgi:hypothetical protein
MTLQSGRSPNRDSFETPPWDSWDKKPFGCRCHGKTHGEPFAGREATAPSIIREIEKVQGGEQAPRNGSLTLPKYLAVKPFNLKGLLYANLIVLIPILARGPDGLPSGHANFSRGLPRLEQDPFEGVLAVEMLAASFRPKVVEHQAPEDVERLSPISEATRVIAVEVRGVVFLFEHGLP